MSFFDDIAEWFTFKMGRPPKMRILPSRKVTPAITEWSKEMVFTEGYPIGTMLQKEFDGMTVIGRIEHHTWTTDKKTGKRIYSKKGYRGITLYELY